MSKIISDEEIGGVFAKEEWSCLEECDVRLIAKAQRDSSDTEKDQGWIDWLAQHTSARTGIIVLGIDDLKKRIKSLGYKTKQKVAGEQQ